MPAACLLSVGTALPLTSGAVRQLFLPTLRVVVVRSLAAGTGFVGLFAATSLRGTGAQQCTCSFIKLSTVSSHVFRLLAVKSPLFFFWPLFGLPLASLWPPVGLSLALYKRCPCNLLVNRFYCTCQSPCQRVPNWCERHVPRFGKWHRRATLQPLPERGCTHFPEY